jgi:hypothetical protein
MGSSELMQEVTTAYAQHDLHTLLCLELECLDGEGPAGERRTEETLKAYAPFNAARPMPERNAAALIGKIGEKGDPFFIGDLREPLRMRGAGRLFLGINDDYLADNSGSLRVVIGY